MKRTLLHAVVVALATGCSSSSGSSDANVLPSDDAAAADAAVLDTSPALDGARLDAAPPNDASPSRTDAPGSVGPDVAGPYAVTMSSTMITGASAVAFVPTMAAGERAPLFVFKHGFQLSTANYAQLMTRIASHGFIAVGVDTTSSLFGGSTNVDERDAMMHAIDWALGTAPFASRVDSAHVAVGGHSRGGKDAVLAAAADSRVTAVLLLDPVNGCGPGMGFSATCPDAASASEAGALTVPVGVMGETNDGTGGFMPCAPLAQNYDTIFAAIHASPWAVEWTFADAVHMTFTDDGGGTFGRFCAAEPADVATLRDEIATLGVAFLRYHLRGEADMAPWLTGSSVPSGITRVGP